MDHQAAEQQQQEQDQQPQAGAEQGDDLGSMPIIVVKDSATKAPFAHLLPRKGPDPYAVDRISRDLQLLGHRRFIFKSDQEPAILALKDAVPAEHATVKDISPLKVCPLHSGVV